jgi:UDP-2,3-diacylglucosamine hydrolase
MKSTGKVYFASDWHLGLHPQSKSAEREKIIVRWLKEIGRDAQEIYLLGDIFDFWHEYKKVVPRGFTRVLGTLAELSDAGIKIHFFTGNHDVWVYDYLPNEIGLSLYRDPVEKDIMGKKFFLGHGDGVGKGDTSYKILRWAFTNKVLQWFFARLHPNFALWIGHTWSKKSRYAKGISENFHGMEKELLVGFAREKIKQKPIDYFVFGHRHIPMDIKIGDSARLINLGEWIYACTYAVFDGETLELKSYRETFDPGALVEIIENK